MRRITACAIGILSAMNLCLPASAEPSATGIWEQTNSEGKPIAWIAITENSGIFGGRYIKILPDGEKEWQDRCQGCLRAPPASIIGKIVMYGMLRRGLDYKNGYMLDVRDGATYHLNLRVSEDGENIYYSAFSLGVWFCSCHDFSLYRVPEEVVKSANISKELLLP